jgi:hypothetical protein
MRKKDRVGQAAAGGVFRRRNAAAADREGDGMHGGRAPV